MNHRPNARQTDWRTRTERNQNDWFFDQFDNQMEKSMDNFDRNFNRMAGGIVAVWVIGALLTIAFWAVVIWAIVQGVQWLQTQ